MSPISPLARGDAPEALDEAKRAIDVALADVAHAAEIGGGAAMVTSMDDDAGETRVTKHSPSLAHSLNGARMVGSPSGGGGSSRTRCGWWRSARRTGRRGMKSRAWRNS